MADLNSTGGEYLLHHSKAQGKAEVEPNREADHLGRKTVASIQ
jgi:hypothetical protein